jgi:hypothetical protein
MTQPQGAASHPPVGRIVLAVLGGLTVLVGLVVLVGGAALVWAHGTQRDADGYFTTDAERLETLTHAIVSDEIDLGAGREDWAVDLGDLATVRLTADPIGGDAVFVGIGPADDVRAYLDGVAHAELDDAYFDRFEVRYRFADGGEPESPPTEQEFWVASADGTGAQTLEWELESGRYAVVIMNADGSAGVGAATSVGVKLDWILPLGIGLLVAAFFTIGIGTAMLVAGAHGISVATRGAPVEAAAVAVPGEEPVRLTGLLDPQLSRWLWLVKWLLLIPHFVVLAVLWVAVAVVTFVAGVAILFTGRYPRALFDFTLGVLRWSWRVGFYSYGAFATDRYPPFTLGSAPDYPATLEIVYPERLSRGLVLVKWWLLAIPHLVVVGILLGGTYSDGQGDQVGVPGLISVLAFFAAVALLFTSRYPRGIFDLLVGLNRWVYRVVPYVLLMTDRYPPFRLDQGPTEPTGPGPHPEPPG